MIQKVALYCLAIMFIFFVLTAGIPSPAAAEQGPSVTEWLNEDQPAGQKDIKNTETNIRPDDSKEKSPILLIFQLIFYTLIILVMIYGLIKFLALKQKKLHPNQAINLIGGTSFGNNKSLQLVKVGGKVFLIGVADQITLIKEFSNEDEISGFEDVQEKQPVSFSKSWFSFLKKQSNINPSEKFESLFNQSLKKQKQMQSHLKSELFDDNEEGRGKR